MADTVNLEALKRQGRGTRTAAKMRSQGKVPGIVYGHKEANVQVALEHKPLREAIFAKARVFNLQMEGKVETVLLREVQWDHLGQDLLHVDLMRVSVGERIQVGVPVELRGVAPGVSEGGVLDQPIHTLHVECPATNIPNSIRINIGELQLNGVIHVREVQCPPDVKLLDDPDAVVVQVTLPRAEPEPGEAAAQVEPERIGRKPTDEETEEK